MRNQISELNLQLVKWSGKIFKDRCSKGAKALLERGRRVSAVLYLRLLDLRLRETSLGACWEVDEWSCYDCKFILAEDLFTELHYILDLMLDLDLCCCDSRALFLQRMQCLYQPSKVGGKSICMFEIWLQKLFLLFDNHIYYYNFNTNPALL